MSRLRNLFLLTAVLLFGTHPAFATEFAVGTCKPSLHSFSTISGAVSTVPAGSIVLVCPGTYAEQVTISQPLTLEGITSGNSNQATITIPPGGLALDARGFAVQVEVTAGPVNIINMTVDGTGNNLGGSSALIAVFYSTGASGVVRDVTTRNQLNSGKGVGIFADNTNSTIEPVTIEDCSVHDFDNTGIQVQGNLTAAVKANHVNASNATDFGINILSAGSVTGNAVTGAGIGIGDGITGGFSGATISDNVVTNWAFGIVDTAAAKYTANTVQNTSEAFFLFQSAGATVESNTITQAANAGIDFDCATATVKSNTINDAGTGLKNVPSGLSSTNTYFNVSNMQTTCSSAALRSGMEIPRKPPTLDRP
jgi:hypothetical protein